ncbi:MAG TPA: dockerin type I domain-containing protein [Lacipirellulaceae bacterium]|jgi:hypothetical protein
MHEQLGIERRAVILVVFVATAVGWSQNLAIADPALVQHDYRFITDKSTVEVTGGFGGIDWPLNILGQFGLVMGYNVELGGPTAHVPRMVPYAAFTDVKAILFDPRRATPMPSPGWDLDKTLNLSGLAATATSLDDLFFSGVEGQGQSIKLEATLSGRLLHLTGANDAGCCDFFNYQVDAWAHQLPWADFNSDGRVDTADLPIWRQSFGSSVAAGTNGDANGDGIVDAMDYTIWRDQIGQSEGIVSPQQAAVPEPAALILGAIALAAYAIAVGRRLHR